MQVFVAESSKLDDHVVLAESVYVEIVGNPAEDIAGSVAGDATENQQVSPLCEQVLWGLDADWEQQAGTGPVCCCIAAGALGCKAEGVEEYWSVWSPRPQTNGPEQFLLN